MLFLLLNLLYIIKIYNPFIILYYVIIYYLMINIYIERINSIIIKMILIKKKIYTNNYG